METRTAVTLAAALLSAALVEAQIRRDPNGVNVNANGATTVLITFGGLRDQVPEEAFWCGELVPATPDIGFKCDPATIFGRLPLRYDQSRLQSGSVLTDIMSIPPSVSRRAYEAAREGSNSAFFYVRRFSSRAGGPDEYVFVTCRMAGGGARVPLALLDVELRFANGESVLALEAGASPPAIDARITYNGTGRLKGRWEVVMPGEPLPEERDLLTAATLPPGERPLQRRYAQLERFNVHLPPTGRHTLKGPDVSRLPRQVEGLYLVLLRVEATDDKEADSNLGLAGAGQGTVHAGAVAGFPMPVLRYFVGGAASVPSLGDGRLAALLPAESAVVPGGRPLELSWVETGAALMVRVELQDLKGAEILSALVRPGVGVYRAPSWLAERTEDGYARWRVVALGPAGEPVAETPWRGLRFETR
jgi:hypothetical protein